MLQVQPSFRYLTGDIVVFLELLSGPMATSNCDRNIALFRRKSIRNSHTFPICIKEKDTTVPRTEFFLSK